MFHRSICVYGEQSFQSCYKIFWNHLVEDETERDASGNTIDPDEPSAGIIIELMNDPVLT